MFEFWRLRVRETPLILVPLNFVKFYPFFIYAYPEKLCASVSSKKFKFRLPCLKGTPKFCQILCFLFIFFP